VARTEAALSQGDLAERAGLSKDVISDIKTGKRWPPGSRSASPAPFSSTALACTSHAPSALSRRVRQETDDATSQIDAIEVRMDPAAVHFFPHG
jgi:transcriptional regulator with XRE-family HTH domain